MQFYASTAFDNWAGVSSLSHSNEVTEGKHSWKRATADRQIWREWRQFKSAVICSFMADIQIQNDGKTEEKNVGRCDQMGQKAKVM